MSVFVFSCLVMLASAAPDGYNYRHHEQLLQTVKPLTSLLSPEQNFPQEGIQNTHVQEGFYVGTNPLHGQLQYELQQQENQQFTRQKTDQSQHQLNLLNYQHQSPIISKDIYVHIPPEDSSKPYAAMPIPQTPPRKYYRIVFIKAPAPKINPTLFSYSPAQTEEKTIIYVLTKKLDPLDVSAAIKEVQPKPLSKPEVYFIKYKTQEEAAYAQRYIQDQYGALGGSTQISDEGVAPVTSVIGALDNHIKLESLMYDTHPAPTVQNSNSSNHMATPYTCHHRRALSIDRA